MARFYEPTRRPGISVWDPFMGSGTTVGEALKLGMAVAGRDINPVAYFAVRNALRPHDREAVTAAFRQLEAEVAPRIRHYYRARLKDGTEVQTLYYFWVRVATCPTCTAEVDLFSSRIFSQHAYPDRHPEARALCPHCGAVNRVHHRSTGACCTACGGHYDPQKGAANRATATCLHGHTFKIGATAAVHGAPHPVRLYAKMVLLPDGSKEYLAADAFDQAVYEEANNALQARPGAHPLDAIPPGYNTNQARKHGFLAWHQMFNDRQLLALDLLAEGIRGIEDDATRELFACLYSGVLEFNNNFTSFKGEGTGAVRHLFAHHVLKPERTPLEANVWGSPKSSGAFSTLFESRIERALDYQACPTELQLGHDKKGKVIAIKVPGLSAPMAAESAFDGAAFVAGNQRLYLSCGNSAAIDLPDGSIDLVVTDPPFFDNVHYSELADFFFVWQRHLLGPVGPWATGSTRHEGEVQHGNATEFAQRLSTVWRECARVLRPTGLLAFTYHHSREEGWGGLLQSLRAAGFTVTAAHPVKSEMSVAAPKSQAQFPIDVDIVFTCRRATRSADPSSAAEVLAKAEASALAQAERFWTTGRIPGLGDLRVMVAAQIVRHISRTVLTWEDMVSGGEVSAAAYRIQARARSGAPAQLALLD